MTDTPTPTPQQAQEPVKAPALPYTFFANLSMYRKRLGVWRIILAFAVSLILFFRFGLIVWLISLAAIILIIGVILFALKKRSITVDADGIEYKNMFGQRNRITYSEIESVKVFINFYDPAFGTTPRVSIAKKGDTSAPIVLVGMYWGLEDLDKLLAVVKDKNVKAEYYDDMAAYGDVAKAFPSYATYLERHTGRVALIATGAMLVVVTAIALLITFVW